MKYSVQFLMSALLLFSGLHAQQNDLKLWYKQPAINWTDALPLGNGHLGGMLYGGVTEDHIQFNESTMWSGNPRNYERKNAVLYLDSIRQLLFQDNQKAAEELAEKKFMGLKDVPDSLYEVQKKNWIKKQTADCSFAQNNFDDAAWPLMQLPTMNGWEESGLQALDGSVWFRSSFVLPKDWAGQALQLDLGRIRDADFTYVNGHLVGSAEGNTLKRSYTIDPSFLHDGKNTIAIQVLNFFDKGGFTGIKENRKSWLIYPKSLQPESGIALSDQWKYFIQDNHPPQFPQYQARYQPFGDIYFKFSHPTEKVEAYRRELDISQAVASVTYTSGGIHFKREYLASNPNNALLIYFSADHSAALSFTASFASAHLTSGIKKINDQTISLNVEVTDGALKGTAMLYIHTDGGNIKLQHNQLVVEKANSASIYVVAATNFLRYNNIAANPEALCAARLQSVKQKTFKQIKQEHISDYQKKFNLFSLSLGGKSSAAIPTDERIRQFSVQQDPSLLTLYVQYARYLLLSCSRSNSTEPANLQGIWNNLLTPPWGSKYTTNINLEMNYWPAELLNLSGCTAPLFKALHELYETGTAVAKAHYGARGWVLHHNTDLWRGAAPINAANHGIWQTGAAWLCKHIWEHYLFTQDKYFLRKNYPLMKGAAQFFEDVLVKDPVTGWLISTPSNSPENGGLVAGPTMDHQIIRELFKNTIEAAALLNQDYKEQKIWQKKLEQIAPNQIGKYGQLQEWLKDKDDTANKHRHVSHLWGVFPGTDIMWNNPAMMRAARQSLIYRGDEGTGWSLAWKVNLWARFKEGDHGMTMVEKLLSPAEYENGSGEKGGVYKNLFDAHPPFQIDGNFGGAAGIAEMLLQSHTGTIELMPALPGVLKEGMVKGLCARGGFEISMRWADNHLTAVTVYSKSGQECKLKYGEKLVSFKTLPGKSYEFNAASALLK